MIKNHSTKITKVERKGQPSCWIDINGNSFSFPAFEGNYISSGKNVTDTGALTFPTGDQVADLIYSAYCDSDVRDTKEMKDIRNKMYCRRLWVANRILWTPKGVYAVQDPQGIGLSQNLAVNELEDELKNGEELSWGGVRFSEDSRVRFAPKGSYHLGSPTAESYANDGFVIASFGLDGAKKIGEISQSQEFIYNPFIWGLELDKGQNPVQRLSSVDNCYGRLDFDGTGRGLEDSGCAFGVKKDNREK